MLMTCMKINFFMMIITIIGQLMLNLLCRHRTCVNGRTITSKTKVKHGDRIVWGNNHFFRINCPKANSKSQESGEN